MIHEPPIAKGFFNHVNEIQRASIHIKKISKFVAFMWRNLFAILFLTTHVNVTMFIAQVDEVDTYDAKGRRQNDINTLGEYIHDIILHHSKKQRPDEDDDTARYCQVSSNTLYDFHQYKVKTASDDLLNDQKKEYSLFIESKWHSLFLDILSPPPKA